MAGVYGNVVTIPSVSEKAPPNPLLGYDKSHTRTPSLATSASGAVTQKTLANKVLLRDQRCLVTGAVSSQIQACHLVNAIRYKSSNKQIKMPLKLDVVRSL